jgi:hypothetical protein
VKNLASSITAAFAFTQISASAHAPIVPFHLTAAHGLSTVHGFNAASKGFIKLPFRPFSLSGSERTIVQAEKNIIFSGVQNGGLKFIGGAITGGQLSGTLYIVNGEPPITFGNYQGAVTTTVNANYNTTGGFQYIGFGTPNPGFSNGLVFSQPFNPLGPVSFQPAKGLQGFFNELGARSVGLGENIFARSFSHLQGGVLVGTIYRNSSNNPAYTVNYTQGQYAFAFGNSPLNIGGTFQNPPIAIPTLSSVTLANGRIVPFANGQLLFPFRDDINEFRFGGLMTFGSNPLNNFTFGSSASNLASFVFLK